MNVSTSLQVMSTGIKPKEALVGFPAATRSNAKTKMSGISHDCSNCGDGFGNCDCKDDCDCKEDCACAGPD